MFAKGIIRGGQQVCRQARRFCYNEPDMRGAVQTLSGERGVNQVILIGNLGRDPEMRGTEQHPVTLFSMATSNTFKTAAGEYVQKTQWHRISVFRPVLRDVVANTCKKGDRVYVQGSLRYSQFEDKDSGQIVKVTSILADDVINLMPKTSKFVEERQEAGDVPKE